jgi:uncharacterized protein (TIGR02996 family)
MSDDAAFLAALMAAPDDDATRLVYADWLDERGDRRADYLRAEYLARDEGGAAVGRALAMREGLDPGWVRAVGAAPTDLGPVWPDIAALGSPPAPAAERRAIERAERRMGVPFPPSYRAFVSRHDGLCLKSRPYGTLRTQQVYGVTQGRRGRRWEHTAVVRDCAREQAERAPHGGWRCMRQAIEVYDSGGSGNNFFLLCGLTDEEGECPVAEVSHENEKAVVVASCFPAFLWFLFEYHRTTERAYREGRGTEAWSPWLVNRPWRELRDPGIARWWELVERGPAEPDSVLSSGLF